MIGYPVMLSTSERHHEECATSFDSKSELADHIHRMHGM